MNPADRTSERVQCAIARDRVALKVLLTEPDLPLRRHFDGKIVRELAGLVDFKDIVWETQVEVLRWIESFHPKQPGSFCRWATAMAMNRLRNAIRWQRSARRVRLPADVLKSPIRCCTSDGSFSNTSSRPKPSGCHVNASLFGKIDPRQTIGASPEAPAPWTRP